MVKPEVERPATGRSLTYLPWMDGMRAIAVIAVMVYHETISQPKLGIDRHFSGGLLGVDIFFAISGFLITSLLLQEAQVRGAINFGAFYLRRARRLLPALGALLAVILVAAVFFQHGHHRTRTLEHVGITAAYSSNWAQAFDRSGMYELGHTWSLAIEEQFYLVWPAILTGLLLLARRSSRSVAVGVAAITAASVLWMEWAAHRHWSFIRIYYGLDTRAASLAWGALLGALFVGKLLPRGRAVAIVRRVLAILGALLVAQLLRSAGWLVILVNHHHLARLQLYAADSIYLLVALGTALVIWELIETPENWVHKFLGSAPLVAVGRISYGLYLWDGTLTAWLSKDSVGVGGWGLVVLRVIMAFAAATASWYLVEARFRKRRTKVAPGAG